MLGHRRVVECGVSDAEVLDFAHRVVALIDGGRRVATYKLAVLTALIDCSAAGQVGADGHLRLGDLAERVVELYWQQVRPAPAADGGRLRQSTQSRSVVIEQVGLLRAAAQAAGARTATQASMLVPDAYRATIAVVAQVLPSQPLGKLQRPQGWRAGSDYPRPLYDDRCYPDKSASRKAVAAGDLDLRLHPGVAVRLAQLSGLLRPLLELAWARDVVSINNLNRDEDDLHRFLFGVDRRSLDPVRDGLADLQAGRCFYCQELLPRRGHIQVDHFLAWSRIPEDGLANLVATDRRCNLDKSDQIAGVSHLRRWAGRDERQLDEVACALRWPSRFEPTHRAVRTIYLTLPDRIPVWTAFGTREPADIATIRQCLTGLRSHTAAG
jgi:5-methylcytosine-specific restriction endonuclease McrA